MRRWWPDRVPLRLRVFFRGAFLLLALAVLMLAVSVLREEKKLSYLSYRQLFDKNLEQIIARLQHPTGQLALLNPNLQSATLTPLRPLLLPFSALDFDDKAKAQQAAEMAGCLMQYPDRSQLCVSVGNNPVAGGFIYIVGAFSGGTLVTHDMGDLDLTRAHRMRVDVSMRGRRYQWIAPLEPEPPKSRSGFRGRLTGFSLNEAGDFSKLPDREFRGWLWQDGRCLDHATAQGTSGCLRRSFFSVRLPVALFHEELDGASTIVWPPKDLGQIQVRIRAYPPGGSEPIFDSNRPGAAAPFALSDLKSQLLAGESLRIRRLGAGQSDDIFSIANPQDTAAIPSPWLIDIIQRLPAGATGNKIDARRVVSTPVGDFEVLLSGDFRSVDNSLGLVVGRVSWFVAAMLLAILLTWIAIEVRIIRRITRLTKRAAVLKRSVHAAEELHLDLGNLRGGDELGLLAEVLGELLNRINEDAKRETIRAEQERDLWHAVGHEIMAPLQSLAALHAANDDPSLRYIYRMRQAVRVLYGNASPSEAILSATLQMNKLDIQAFLQMVADNAIHAGIDAVEYDGVADPVMVKADEHSLEDAITHVLKNADRHRAARSPIRIRLRRGVGTAEVRIFNQGNPIDPALLGRIFEYGVSDGEGPEPSGRRGQGLFVVKTYMAKMGGTVAASNVEGGVEFLLTLTAF